MAGNVGSALMFFMALIATIITGIFFLACVGRALVVVVEDTAAGNEEATWPDEPFQDWILGVVVLVWLIAIWLAPYGLILRITKPAIIAEHPVLGVVIGAVVMWLFFPIGLLSSLASTNRWNPIHWRIILGMIRLAPSTLLFYACSFVIVAVSLATWIVAIIVFPLLVVPVGALVGGAAILLYARLLGRLAQQISVLQPLRRARAKVKVAPPERPPLNVELVHVNDPWAEPTVQNKTKNDRITKPSPVQAPPPKPTPTRNTTVDDEWEVGGTYGMSSDSERTGPSQTDLYAPPPVEEESEEDELEPRRKKRKAKPVQDRRKHDRIDKPAPIQPPQPKPVPTTTTTVDDEWEVGGTYGMSSDSERTGPSQSDLYAPPPEPVVEEAEEDEPGVRRKKRKAKRKADKPAMGIWSFPFYACSRGSLATLTILGFMFGAAFQWFLSALGGLPTE